MITFSLLPSAASVKKKTINRAGAGLIKTAEGLFCFPSAVNVSQNSRVTDAITFMSQFFSGRGKYGDGSDAADDTLKEHLPTPRGLSRDIPTLFRYHYQPPRHPTPSKAGNFQFLPLFNVFTISI